MGRKFTVQLGDNSLSQSMQKIAPYVSPLGDKHEMSQEMQADMARWNLRQAEKRKPAEDDRKAFLDAMTGLKTAFDNAPETVVLPPHLTPEGERLQRFRHVCEAEFMQRIDRARLLKPAAFDEVADWDGAFPGPLAFGPTGTAKTRAAWSALGRLFVRDNRAYAWFPVKRLITEFTRFESKDLADEFFKWYGPSRFQVLMVDDLDKINWQFESESAVLFQFYDWIYRCRIPCITTTNKDRKWWTEHAGDAFVRRLFDEAHNAVQF